MIYVVAYGWLSFILIIVVSYCFGIVPGIVAFVVIRVINALLHKYWLREVIARHRKALR